ncbi:hypothetical protein FSARC_8557 [Fusarium sarcochroum]|uniref:Peptidase S8/S53 domain-containing protein n=1 Tax=Fusarium sarcochroum TaxID=1208366 RepID=A0A8H4X722_9HYPO|nr:hypothetical protein FSARC_8557 [Fusarium sarcochroum]
MLISIRPIPSPANPVILTVAVENPAIHTLARKDPMYLRRPSRRGDNPSHIGRWSDLYKLHQDDKREECTTLSPPPHRPSGPELNLPTDTLISSDLTNNRAENADGSNPPDIMEQNHNTPKEALGKDTYGFTKNMEGLDLGVLQSAGLEASENSAQQWFKKLESTTHQVLYGQNLSPSTPVKVAVLDTGFAYTNPEDKRILKPYYQRVKKFANFIDGDTDLDAKKDPSGHGTAVAVQILKVSLRAVLYICRVASFDGTNTAPDTSAVERAIRKAAAKPDKDRPDGGGWGVDIINMSFGWSFQHEGVRQGIDFARQNGVHLYASTSNYGLLGPPNDILYPARSDNVIAIDAADGLGEHARTAPSLSSPYSRGSRFSAPGLGLSSPNSETTWSGSSFACPIATGIGALVLEFARQPPLSESQSVQRCLQDTPAMLALFRHMSSEKGLAGLKFLTPWKLTGESSEERLFVSVDIVKELRKEYGPQVGSEISWRFL